jgi:hypothetical protein
MRGSVIHVVKQCQKISYNLIDTERINDVSFVSGVFDMESDKQNGQKSTVPVYLSFKTFQSAIQSLRVHGLPDNLDRTAFGSRSGAEQTQILSAFRFLGLLNDKDQTQDALRTLVTFDENSNEEKQVFAEILKEKYANAFALNLEAATPAQLDRAIGDYGATGATRDRAVRFFIKAAEHCAIKLSSRLTARKPRSASTASGNGEDTTAADTGSQREGRSTHKHRKVEPPSPITAGSAIKSITLPGVDGTLTISGNFNFFGLVEDERKLVFDIIDLMNGFEKAHPTEDEEDDEQD